MIIVRPQAPRCWALHATAPGPSGQDRVVASWVLEWIDAEPRVALFHGWRGKLTRTTLRELVVWLVSHGVDEVRAGRAHAKLLPGAVVDDAGVVHVDVAALAHLMATPGASNWADL